MRFRSLAGGQARLHSLAMTLACVLFGSAAPALAAGATFELAQVVDLLKREIAAADAPADDSRLPVHIDEAQLDLDLVEVPGKAGARLVVPGSDFATGQEDPPKPALKRRIIIDFTPAKDTKRAEPLEPVANPRGGAVGTLARAINEVEAALRTGVETPPPYELKRAGIDLEFALERNAKGAPTIVVFAANRRIEPKNVQKLRLKLSARDK
ncbi:MAG: hypothetical protein ACXW3M_12165 [Rhodoplanes sp.]